MTFDRYDRQRRLAEIGSDGQERIRASEARIAAGASAATTLAYLVRAGVERGVVARAPQAPFPHAARFRFDGPANLGAGAHAALRHLVSAVRER